jgi:hypothetical protein
MLFDLRGRGRRRTVQAIYLGLAILMGGGLVLFGVGTGTGGGGLLNGLSSNGGSGAAQAYVSQQTKNAEKQTKLHPNDAQAWATLVQARYDDAGQNFNSTTNSYTASGKLDLTAAATAWQRYQQLDTHPSPTLARLIAEAYAGLGNYTQEAAAWQIVAAASPKVAIYWEYVAVAAYQAKNTDLGDLAAAKAVSLVPKAQRTTLKSELASARAQSVTTSTTTPTVTPTTSTTSTTKTTTTHTGTTKK